MPLDVDGAKVGAPFWVRHSRPGRPPGQLSDPAPAGRWHRGEVIRALYLASDEATAWAEWYRFLAEAALPPDVMLPRALWTWEVDPDLIVADLRGQEQRARVGLPLSRPDRRTWRPFQEVGEALWREGWPGLITASAARPEGGMVLVLFHAAQSPALARPIEPPRLVERPPVPPRGMRT